MREYRWDRLQQAMKKFGLGAMIFYDYDNQRYAGYYNFHQYARRRLGAFCVVVAGEKIPYTAKEKYPGAWVVPRMPWFEGHCVLEESRPYQLCNGLPDHPNAVKESFMNNVNDILPLLQKHGVADMPVGIDITSQLMSDVLREGGIKLVDAWNAIVWAITEKSEDEIHCLRMAGVITDAAHFETAQAMRVGMTELEIAGIGALACYKHGAEELEGPSFVVCSGERSGQGVPNMPTDRRVRVGDMVALDLNGVSFQGYRTCHYRTYLVGAKPTAFQKEIFGKSRDGQLALQSVMKPNTDTVSAQKEWLKLGDFPGGWGREAKFPEPGFYYYGSGAHPIGMRSGDPGPALAGSNNIFGKLPGGPINVNNTFATEVGCFHWDGKRWAKDGVKNENCGVVTETGFELFYRSPIDELMVVGMPGEYATPTPTPFYASPENKFKPL